LPQFGLVIGGGKTLVFPLISWSANHEATSGVWLKTIHQ